MSLSPRDMRRLGDWVLANHETIDHGGLTQAEATARASEQLTFALDHDNLMTAYESVDVEWRPRQAKSPADWRDKDLATMAEAIRDLCVCEAVRDPTAPASIDLWDANADRMAEIRDRFAPPLPSSNGDLFD